MIHEPSDRQSTSHTPRRGPALTPVVVAIVILSWMKVYANSDKPVQGPGAPVVTGPTKLVVPRTEQAPEKSGNKVKDQPSQNSAASALDRLVEREIDDDLQVRALQAELTRLDERMEELRSLSGIAEWLPKYQELKETKASAQKKLGERKVSIRPAARQKLEASLREQIKEANGAKNEAASIEALAARELLKREPQLATPRNLRDVVAAWQRAGAEFGWIKINEVGGGPHWQPLANPGELRSLPGSPFSRTNPQAGLYGAVRFTKFPSGKLQKLPGKDLCIRLYLDTCGVVDDDLKEVAQLHKLQWLTLYRDEISDKGLEHLAGLKEIRRIGLHNSKVTDKGMDVIARFKGLEGLGIGMTKVTDKGFAKLEGLTQLWLLDIGGTGVTDNSLDTLLGMKKMRALWLSAGISENGRDRIRKAFPEGAIF